MLANARGGPDVPILISLELDPHLPQMRRSHWILWLMLALLPLRGWAFAAMAIPAVGQPPDASAAASALPPCHEQLGSRGDHEQAEGSGHNCTLCEICHGAAVPAALLAVAAPLRVTAIAPDWRTPVPADAERQALFKPPRG